MRRGGAAGNSDAAKNLAPPLKNPEARSAGGTSEIRELSLDAQHVTADVERYLSRRIIWLRLREGLRIGTSKV